MAPDMIGPRDSEQGLVCDNLFFQHLSSPAPTEVVSESLELKQASECIKIVLYKYFPLFGW